jgi:hypothetical protein
MDTFAIPSLDNLKIGPPMLELVERERSARLERERQERRKRKPTSSANLLYQVPGNFSPSPEQHERREERLRRLRLYGTKGHPKLRARHLNIGFRLQRQLDK